ncbi:MAG: hypothetical protein NTZ52_04935 [Chlamydiae bacterium]|nr:hypothetical protein [Chlamydiota bacterium]
MKTTPFWLPLLLATLCTLFASVFIPDIKLATFAPLLAIAFHRTSLLQSLWISVFCGLFIDTCSSQHHYGLHALCFALATPICYYHKRHFFEEKAVALSLYTSLISSVYALILITLTTIFHKQFVITFDLMLSEALLTPIFDALYAFLCFTVPMRLYIYIRSGKWKERLKKTEETRS